MKKIFLTIIINLLLLSNVIAVPMPPMPIGGKIYSTAQSVSNLLIEVENMETGDILTTRTTSTGEWLVDMANAPKGYRIGDNVEIRVVSCYPANVCVHTVKIDGNPIFVKMDITEAVVCPECPECPECVCPECPECPDCICPEYTSTVITTTVCPECEECIELNEENCSEFCPDVTINYIIEAIILFLLGMGTYRYGLGVKLYTKKTGEIAKLHKHPGIKAYHSPDVIHMNPDIRHPKGMMFPKYKKINGKWKYVGD